MQRAVCAEIEGGASGETATQVKLADCGKSPAGELLVGLASALGTAAAADSDGGCVFVFAERDQAGLTRLATTTRLPAQALSAVFANSTVNVSPAPPRHGMPWPINRANEYNFGGVKGNVAVGSSDFSQVYHDGFDVAKVGEFADLITEIAGTLELEPDQQAELEAGTGELRAAVDDPAADRACMRRAIDAVMGPLRLAGAIRSAATSTWPSTICRICNRSDAPDGQYFSGWHSRRR